MPLKLRLVLSVAAILVISLGASGALAWLHAARSVQTEMSAALVVSEHAIRNAIPHLVDSTDQGAELRRLVDTFDGDRHLRATLEGPAGEVVAQSSLAIPNRAAPRWFVRLLDRHQPAIALTLPRNPIATSILLQTDPRNEIGEVWTAFGDNIETTLLFGALTFILVYWALGRALKPLEVLSQALVEVGPGVSSAHLPERGPPELVGLAQGFNAMIDRLAQSERKNQRLNDQLATIQEEERAELARDLHDDIGPYLFAIGVDATGIQKSAETIGHDGILGQVQSIRDSVSHIQQQVRAILGRLRSGGLTEFGLLQAIENLRTFWISRHPELVITIKAIGAEAGFGEALDATVYRIIQESLNNAMRHGKPGRIGIEIRHAPGSELVVSISDDGRGLDAALSKQGMGPKQGMGLRGMAERVTASGGVFDIVNRPDRSGTTVTAWLPLPRETQAATA